jgi:hypothetical protein
MKNYTLYSKFDFGKYKGEKLLAVAMKNVSYIEWCVLKVEKFYIDSLTIEAIRQSRPHFMKGPLVTQKQHEKAIILEKEIEDDKNEAGFGCDFESQIKEYHRNWDVMESASGDWDFDPMNPAHISKENPWLDVFGPGDESEAAYWSTH